MEQHTCSKFHIFDENRRLNPVRKCKLFHSFKWHFYSLKRMFFHWSIIKQYIQAYFIGSYTWKKFQIFDQNRGLTPLGKCNLFDFLKMTFLYSRKDDLSIKHYQTIYKAYSIEKLHMKEILNFWPKSWTNPFAKVQIFRLFENDLFKV